MEEVFLKCARSILSRIESGLINPKSMIGGGVRPYGNDDGNVSILLLDLPRFTWKTQANTKRTLPQDDGDSDNAGWCGC